MSYLSSGKTITYLVARLCCNHDRYLSGAPSYPSNNSEPFLYVLYSHQLQWYRFPLASPASLERRLSALQLQNEMLITGFSPSSWIGTIDVSPILDWLLKNSSEPGTILIREEPVAPTASCIGLPVDNNTVVQFLPGGRFGVVLGGRCTHHDHLPFPYTPICCRAVPWNINANSRPLPFWSAAGMHASSGRTAHSKLIRVNCLRHCEDPSSSFGWCCFQQWGGSLRELTRPSTP